MSKKPVQKYKKPSTNSKLYKKRHSKYLQETILLLYLPANSEVLTHMQEVMSAFLQLCVVQHIKKNLKLQVILFDGWWGTRWWHDVDKEAENEWWAVGVEEEGKLGSM